MLTGSCHCGAVHIEVAHKPESLTECNCSICHRYGARWAYYTRSTARVICSPEAETAYVWGDRTIEFYHCSTCGSLTHWESVEKLPDSRMGVNTRIMQQDQLADVPVRKLDGASTWEYLED